MKRITKKDIFSRFGIEYDSKKQKVLHPILGWINKPLVKGNKKIGPDCWHFSTLPTCQIFTVEINGNKITLSGTCACTCEGCYATTGNYCYSSVKRALAIRTIIIRTNLSWFTRCAMAQIEADKIKKCRIHASGDFDSLEYLMAWKAIIRRYPDVKFWTYTKVKEYETAFDEFDNANIVRSMIDGIGYNFGHCGYIKDTREKLLEKGESVYICRCGVDDEQHCSDCTGCSDHKFVLFIEHSTAYVAKSDPEYAGLTVIINNQ